MENKKDPGFDKFLKAFKSRLFYAESNGGEYTATNKDSTAMGKYQFLESVWMPEIKKFAKKEGWETLAKEKGEKIDKDFFLKNPMLQETFFDHYAKDVYKNVKALSENNKRNLDIDEIAQLYHLSPKAAKNFVSGGEWNPSGKQTPLPIYLKKGKQGMEEFGAPTIKKADTMTEEQLDGMVNRYLDKTNQIKTGGFSTEVQKQLILEVQKEAKADGMIRHINNAIGKEVDRKREVFNEDRKLFEEFYNVMANAQSLENGNIFNLANKNKVRLKASGGSRYAHISIEDKKSQEIVKAMAEKSGGKIKTRKYKDALQLNFRLTKEDPTAKFIADNIEKYSGDNVYSEKNGGEIDPNALFNNPDDGLLFSKDKLMDSFKPRSFKRVYVMEDSDKGINPETIPDIEKNIEKKEVQKQPEKKEELPIEKGPDQVNDTDAVNPEPEKKLGLLNNLEELQEPDNLNYDKKAFGQKIPYEAVASALLAFKGLKDSKTPVPKRNEQVSAMVTDYLAKVGEIAKMGLPVEVEAQAKARIAAGAQLGIKNIVNASGGNRNLVLGNQGQVDVGRMNALANLAVEDAKAKNQALAVYGEGAKYIDQFNRNREVANKRLEQELALEKRRSGGELAAAGFSSLIDNIQAQRENAPGTMKHVIGSMVRQNAFGFDPEMKDDGSGSLKGTKSWYEKNVVGKIKEHNDSVSFINDNYGLLDDNKKEFVNKVNGMTTDLGIISAATKFAAENEIGNPDDAQLMDAVKNNNFSSLTRFAPLPESTPEAADNNLYSQYLNS